MNLRFVCENSSDLDEIWKFVDDFIDIPCLLWVSDQICTVYGVDFSSSELDFLMSITKEEIGILKKFRINRGISIEEFEDALKVLKKIVV